MSSLVVNGGYAIATGRMIGATPTQPEPLWVGWGTGVGTTQPTDTTLFSETTYVGYSRIAAVTSQVTTAVLNDTYQQVAELINQSLVPITITNAGSFDAITGGNLFVKGDFVGLTINPAEGIKFTITIQFE